MLKPKRIRGAERRSVRCVPIVRADTLYEQEAAIRVAAIRDQMWRSGFNFIAASGGKVSCRHITSTSGDGEDSFKHEVMISGFAVIVPGDSLTGRSSVNTRA